MTLPIQPQNYGKLEEDINTFTFRNEGEIKIPKEKREIAYFQSVDIIVQSIDYNLYENRKGKPPIQFYGYAVLVFQDCLSNPIPIVYPRQRIFEFFNWEALRQWNEMAVFWEHWQYYRRLELELGAIKSALEIPDTVQYSDDFGDTKFKEGTLLEVYVKLQKNTQFEIEYVQWQPVEYTDPLGNDRKGKSDQRESEKDKGLPKDGIQPKKNEKDNPFGGNPPFSGIPTLENGFFIDAGNLDEVDPENSGEELKSSCTVRLIARTDNGQLINDSTVENVIVPRGAFFVSVRVPCEKYGDIACNNPFNTDGQVTEVRVRLPDDIEGENDRYFTGTEIVDTPTFYTVGEVETIAVCTPIE